MVVARRQRGGPVQPADLLVDAAQHLQRVEPLDAGVVGDLVVAEEVGVDHGPAGQHVLEQGGGDDVAGDDRRPRPREGVDAAAGDARADVGPALGGRGGQLAVDVDQRDPERADGVHGVGEVGVVARAHPVAPAADPGAAGHDVRQRAHRQADVGGVAGEQVAAAGAVGSEQPAPVGVPALQGGGIVGRGHPDDLVALLVVPAEADDVVVGAVQDAEDRGAGLRAPVGVPRRQHVAARAQPAGEGRHGPVPDGAARGAVPEPVDLQEEDAGRPRPGRGGPPAPAPGAAEEDLVLVDRERGADPARHGRHGHGDRDRGAEAADHDARDGGEQGEHAGAHEQEPAEAQREEGQGQRDPHDERPQHGGEQAEQQGGDRRMPPGAHREAAQGAVEHRQRGRGDRPDQHDTGERAAGLQDPAGGGSGGHRRVSRSRRSARRPRRGAGRGAAGSRRG